MLECYRLPSALLFATLCLSLFPFHVANAGGMVPVNPIVGSFKNFLYVVCANGIGEGNLDSEGTAIARSLNYLKGNCGQSTATMTGDWQSAGDTGLDCGKPRSNWPHMAMGMEGDLYNTYPGDANYAGTTNSKPYEITYNILVGTSCVAQPPVQMSLARGRVLGCPGNSSLNSDKTACVRPSTIPDPAKRGGGCPASKGSGSASNSMVGNPCDAASGNKYENHTDYTGSGPFPLVYTRHYNSGAYDAMVKAKGGVGTYWRASYFASLSTVTVPINGTPTTTITVMRPNGVTYYFALINGAWASDSDIPGQLVQTSSGWKYLTGDGTVESYQTSSTTSSTSQARLASITNPAGLIQTLSYDSAGRLAAVTDSFGHSLAFGYDANNRVTTLTTPDNKVIGYSYDSKNNLVQISYPDSAARLYYYEKSTLPNSLTGVAYASINPDNSLGTAVRTATFDYDTTGRATLTQHADIGGGGPQEKFTLTYNSDSWTTVTGPTNTQELLGFSTNLGVKLLTTKKNLADNKYVTQTFDTNNNLSCRLDEQGRVSTFTYNATNQLVSKTEGQSGNCALPTATSVTRTTTYQYFSPVLDLPTVIESPSVYGANKKRITISYSGNLPTVIAQSGYTPTGGAVSRTISLSYNAAGQVTSINGARTDANDVTTLTYYECSSGGACGQLQRITNALGQITSFDSYDATGRLLEMTDPNGLKTRYTYDARGRVASVTQLPVGGVSRTTSYTYDAAGNVLTASLPTGLTITYTYSAALKLTRVTDNLGNRVDYSYDLKGNRTSEQTYDPSGVLVRSIDTAYDVRNRVSQLNDGGSITKQVMDAVGNLTKVTDPNTVAANGTAATTNTFDALNRLTKTVDLLAGNTNYTYDVNDRLKSAQAANGATTQYQVDDLGNLTKEISPDRGTTSYTYDAAGNVLTQTDARGVTASYGYDVLNRLTNVSYADSSENIAYTYDSGSLCTYGVGRLCRVQDGAGASDYGYDGFGNVLTHTRTELNVSYVTRYAYDSGNRVTGITYPNGRQVDYTRDARGNLLTASMALGGTVTPLVTESLHRPDGQLTSRRYGNGLNETRAYSLQGKLREQYLGSADTRLYSYDPNGNLTAEQSLPQVGAYSYDTLNRLTHDQITSTPASNTTFTYDANGNRKTAGTGTYAYLASSNRLTNALGTGISLDAAGNTTGDGARSYSYHQAGTLGAVTGIATYRYNAQRQRTRKVMGSELTVYHYDLAGNLIAETRVDGSLIRDYVWVDSTPVAQVDSGERLTYLHTDHLNTPRLGTDSTQQVVWRWEGKAFGDTAASGAVTVNLRFPGQYYDGESGLLYNWNRYYDPKTGRYVTSDPSGLYSPEGLNTYIYSVDNPMYWIDPTGLDVHVLPPWIPTGNPNYGNWFLTTNQFGIPTGFFPGSTKPDLNMPKCSKGCPEILPGTYPFTKKDYKKKGNPALEIGGGGNVDTVGPNPNQNGNSFMNGAWIHRGGNNRRYSEGCLTLDPSYWDDFISNVGKKGDLVVW